MNVLVACEESQEVCKAFRARGHNAYSCDLQECSGGHPEWHIKDDVLAVLYPDKWRGTNLHLQSGHICRIFKWDLIIAHPPCTFLSAAGACRMYPTKGIIDHARYEKAMAAREFFMKLWLNSTCGHICIENPRPLKCVNLPKETQRIQPYQFGDPWSKQTYLWLYGLPELQPTKICSEYKPYISCGTSRNKGNPDKAGFSRAGGAQKVRSRTFSGIAEAMADQWNAYILNEEGDNNG